MFPYDSKDDIPDEIWDYVESFEQFDEWCLENYV
jgi:hypothetical protein